VRQDGVNGGVETIQIQAVETGTRRGGVPTP